ncbi:hypothetical protein U9M48_041148 [Paspalum notatum var. saurae]|uniref:Uncharacterized protein n=1 Tax=Paspalum notatum var. saurae TaxID=547442 RepID=A0AAQ3XD18_PASNO
MAASRGHSPIFLGFPVGSAESKYPLQSICKALRFEKARAIDIPDSLYSGLQPNDMIPYSLNSGLQPSDMAIWAYHEATEQCSMQGTDETIREVADKVDRPHVFRPGPPGRGL